MGTGLSRRGAAYQASTASIRETANDPWALKLWARLRVELGIAGGHAAVVRASGAALIC